MGRDVAVKETNQARLTCTPARADSSSKCSLSYTPAVPLTCLLRFLLLQLLDVVHRGRLDFRLRHTRHSSFPTSEGLSRDASAPTSSFWIVCSEREEGHPGQTRFTYHANCISFECIWLDTLFRLNNRHSVKESHDLRSSYTQLSSRS